MLSPRIALCAPLFAVPTRTLCLFARLPQLLYIFYFILRNRSRIFPFHGMCGCPTLRKLPALLICTLELLRRQQSRLIRFSAGKACRMNRIAPHRLCRLCRLLLLLRLLAGGLIHLLRTVPIALMPFPIASRLFYALVLCIIGSLFFAQLRVHCGEIAHRQGVQHRLCLCLHGCRNAVGFVIVALCILCRQFFLRQRALHGLYLRGKLFQSADLLGNAFAVLQQLFGVRMLPGNCLLQLFPRRVRLVKQVLHGLPNRFLCRFCARARRSRLRANLLQCGSLPLHACSKRLQFLFTRHLRLYLCRMRVLQRAAHRTRCIFAQITRQNARLSAHPMQFRCAACLFIALIPLLLLQIACLLFVQLLLTLCQFRKQIPLAFQLLFPLGCLSPVAAQRFLSHLTGM